MPAGSEAGLVEAALGLGGNLGDRRAFIARALQAIGERPGIRLTAVSALYETEPWGRTDQPRFLNAAARIVTVLAPRALLEACISVERSLGRERGERWGPRTIDIDILLYGDREVDEPGLTVPHPRLTERAFVLAPLADVMPEARLAGKIVTEWLATTSKAGLARVAEDNWFELSAKDSGLSEDQS